MLLDSLNGLIRAMRPRQWTKNALVYGGIVFDGQLFVPASFLRVTASFILLCLMSSAIYIINDLVDIESDRQHPKKRFRAIASGQLAIPTAQIAAVILVIFTVGCAALFSVGLA